DEPAPLIHPRFGTATLTSGPFRVDLASARQESYERPGALPSVQAGDIRQDLTRRDYTINAMAIRIGSERNGWLEDPLGGYADLQHGILKVLHDRSFEDDATRIVRGVRYEQRLGFAFEEHSLALLLHGIPYLRTISPDRLRHEIDHILQEDEPEQMLLRLDDLGVLSEIDESLSFGAGQVEGFQRARAARLSPARLEATLWCVLGWGLDEDGLASVAMGMNLPARLLEPMRDSLFLRSAQVELAQPELRPGDVYGMLSNSSLAALTATQMLYELPLARSRVSSFLAHLRHVRPSLDGQALMDLGFSQGPVLGDVLSKLLMARLNGEVGSREEEKAMAQRLLAQEPDASS
ncbi:MAG: CCA tRNA nucleotidyltransferase, partial [Dehalococcoidia bacterium]|nr:CCA tRNA nucleotidyltransferase [Dehalococcoidia bacterium]